MIEQEGNLPDHGAALEAVLAGLKTRPPAPEPRRSGASGGSWGYPVHTEPQWVTRVTPELIAALLELIPLSPDHLPQAVQGAVRADPDLPEVACFDTAFHRHMPRTAQLYPLPWHLADEGVVRYEFHGLSYESILRELLALTSREAEGRGVISPRSRVADVSPVVVANYPPPGRTPPPLQPRGLGRTIPGGPAHRTERICLRWRIRRRGKALRRWDTVTTLEFGSLGTPGAFSVSNGRASRSVSLRG